MEGDGTRSIEWDRILFVLLKWLLEPVQKANRRKSVLMLIQILGFSTRTSYLSHVFGLYKAIQFACNVLVYVTGPTNL